MTGRVEITRISVAVCSHGTIFIQLHGVTGAVVVEAMLLDETAISIADELKATAALPRDLRRPAEGWA